MTGDVGPLASTSIVKLDGPAPVGLLLDAYLGHAHAVTASIIERHQGWRRARYRDRGKGIARPEQPLEPKQSWRAQCPPAWMSAIAQRARFAGPPIPSKHNHVLHRHGPYRGTLRSRSRGCRLATRSGHLVPAGTRAAPYRPDRERGRG